LTKQGFLSSSSPISFVKNQKHPLILFLVNNYLKECNFLGITTNNPKSIADKLYSPHLPFVRYDEQWIKMYRYAGYCGKKSNVYLLKEKFLQSAMKIAENQKISCEPSGIVGLALMLQMRNTLPKDKKMLIINTGKSKF